MRVLHKWIIVLVSSWGLLFGTLFSSRWCDLLREYIESRGVDLFNEVVRRNLEGIVAKRKIGTYMTVSDWLKIKNPEYTQSERRYQLFESFNTKPTNIALPPIPKKPPLRAVPISRKTAGKSRRPSVAD